MLTKCICTYCAGHLEFEEENAGEKIKCPHCGFETTLFLPGEEPPEAEEAGREPRRGSFSKRAAIISVAVVLSLVALGYSIHRWVLPPIKDWLNTESAVLPVAVFLAGLLIFCLVLVWTVFPVLLLLQIRRLTALVAGFMLSSRPVLPAEPLVKENGDRAAKGAEEEDLAARRV